MSSPAKKAKDRALLEELAAAGKAATELEAAALEAGRKRDELLLRARAEVEPRPSLRDVAALGQVSHAWVRKLEKREGLE